MPAAAARGGRERRRDPASLAVRLHRARPLAAVRPRAHGGDADPGPPRPRGPRRGHGDLATSRRVPRPGRAARHRRLLPRRLRGGAPRGHPDHEGQLVGLGQRHLRPPHGRDQGRAPGRAGGLRLVLLHPGPGVPAVGRRRARDAARGRGPVQHRRAPGPSDRAAAGAARASRPGWRADRHLRRRGPDRAQLRDQPAGLPRPHGRGARPVRRVRAGREAGLAEAGHRGAAPGGGRARRRLHARLAAQAQPRQLRRDHQPGQPRARPGDVVPVLVPQRDLARLPLGGLPGRRGARARDPRRPLGRRAVGQHLQPLRDGLALGARARLDPLGDHPRQLARDHAREAVRPRRRQGPAADLARRRAPVPVGPLVAQRVQGGARRLDLPVPDQPRRHGRAAQGVGDRGQPLRPARGAGAGAPGRGGRARRHDPHAPGGARGPVG